MNIKPSQNCEEFSLPSQATLPAWNEQGNGHHESIPPDWVDNPIRDEKPTEAVPNAGAWVIPLVAGLAFIWKIYTYRR